ncbi:MAG: hypothetical protein ACC609_05775 [Methanobacterium formicicum]
MESENDVKITEKDVIEIMDVFTRVPPLLLKVVVKGNKNVVKSFESQIKEHYSHLTPEEVVKIEKVMTTPVPELQSILKNVYAETHQKQLKILSSPGAEPFITRNLQELKTVLSSMDNTSHP